MDKEEISSKLTSFVHDLFTSLTYREWKKGLFNQEKNRWFSLIVELDNSNCSISELKEFGEDIYSIMVYRCIPTPHFKKSGEIMVLFNVAGWIWNEVIYIEKVKGKTTERE